MTIDPITATIGSALLGAAMSGFQGQSQAKQAKKTASANAEATAKTQAQAEQEINRKNAKSPDTAALLSQNQQDAAGGSSSATMLSGPTGVDPNSLMLGKNTLLGGGA